MTLPKLHVTGHALRLIHMPAPYTWAWTVYLTWSHPYFEATPARYFGWHRHVIVRARGVWIEWGWGQ